MGLLAKLSQAVISRELLISAVAVSLVSCASTGPVPMGPNKYTISKTSPACGFRDAGGTKADLLQEIAQFCSEKGLEPEPTSIETVDGVLGRRCASATIEFRCVTSAGADFMPSGQKPDRDINRSPNNPTNSGQFGNKDAGTVKLIQEVQVKKSSDKYNELKQLKELKDKGVLTQEEFDAQKQKILSK